jgi:phenylacetaldehyde dehydrogenase
MQELEPVFGRRAESLRATFLNAPKQLFIDGGWRPAQSGETFDVIDPSTGSVIGKAAAGDSADIDLAVRAARRAFESGPWPKMSAAERTVLLWRLADAIEKNADDLAALESLNVGKPIVFARFGDVAMAIESLRYNAGWATKLVGETVPTSAPGKLFGYTVREPVGVAAQIVPWNAPFAMAVGKIGAALAAGCTVVLKPAEQTPLTAIRLGELISEIGFPVGVVNIVTGFGATAGRALVAHPDVDKVAFTGSTPVGKAILVSAAATLKRVTLELGGKSPTFIFPDTDIEKAAAAAAMGVFFNTGQICVAGSRLYVHESVFDRVVEGIADYARKLVVGPALNPATQMGPLVSKRQLESVSAYIDSGTSEGAKLITGGRPVGREGYFIQPTVLVNTQPTMKVVREEIFGPVVCAMPFGNDDLEDLASKANDTSFGLSARIWTRDVRIAHTLAGKIRAGMIWVNESAGMEFTLPFGGYKQSGFGRENGREGVEAYTELKTVSVGL